MVYIKSFIDAYLMYCQEIWLTLAIGFLISGIFYKCIPASFVERHLGEKGLKPIAIAAFSGTLLPVCCIGSLPIAITLRRQGATLGAVLAFLVATPATSISALLVCWKLMGTTFTVYIFIVIIIMALAMGLITNNIQASSIGTEHDKSECCHENGTSNDVEPSKTFLGKSREVLSYAFVTLPKEIGLEILIGIAIASFITAFEPVQQLIREYLTGMAGYVFILVAGLLTYVCSTASVPMADALMQSGMSPGQALCYLLVGPITSYGTILVIKKDFGRHVLVIYLSVIVILSLAFGLLFDVFVA